MQKQDRKAELATPDALRKFAATVLVRAGCHSEIATEVAEALVEADRSGRHSHGTRLLENYVRKVQGGSVSAIARPTLVSQRGGVLRIAGNGAFGQIVGAFGVAHGVRLAKELGVALVTITNCAHLGWNGHWPALAAEAGMASIHFVNIPAAPPRIAPYGAMEPRLATNPIALGAPGPEGPIVLDFATSAVSANTVRRARECGRRLDIPAIVAADGSLSDDPEIFFASPAPALAPFGGFKGYGLALFSEILAGAVTGGGVQTGAAAAAEEGPSHNLFSVYVDVTAVTPFSEYIKDVRRLAKWIKSATPRDSGAPVVIPGDRSRHARAASEKRILIDAAHWALLDQVAARVDVPYLSSGEQG